MQREQHLDKPATATSWRQRIQSVGLRVTSRRIALLETLDRIPHSTADELYLLTAPKVKHLTKQAVYVSLADFTKHHLVRRFDAPGSPARYETRTGDNHHHLVCDNCGKIVDADCSNGASPCLQPIDSAGFNVQFAEVIYRGICSNCETGQSLNKNRETHNFYPDSETE